MASEDVLERADKVLAPTEDGEIRRQSLAGMLSLIFDLAAEVRELRRDRERLDYAIKLGLVCVWHGEPGQRYSRKANRNDLDAAMGGEAQTHD